MRYMPMMAPSSTATPPMTPPMIAPIGFDSVVVVALVVVVVVDDEGLPTSGCPTERQESTRHPWLDGELSNHLHY